MYESGVFFDAGTAYSQHSVDKVDDEVIVTDSEPLEQDKCLT